MRIFFVLIVSIFTLSATAQVKPHLNHQAIFVVDLHRSVQFYSGVFQLDTIPEPFHDQKHAWYSIAPGVALHVIQGADRPKEYFLNNHMCFSVESVPVFLERLKSAHVQYYNSKAEPGQVTTRVDGVKQIWVNDPDGYWIEINDAKN